jgi:hypothetical protein
MSGLPSYIDVRHSYSTTPGGVIFLKAYGIYDNERIDITRKGRWKAKLGRVTRWGTYNAPKKESEKESSRIIYDRVVFMMGHLSQSIRIVIR